MNVLITRREVARRNGPAGGGWRPYSWLYDVRRPDGSLVVYGTERLSIARRMARAEAKALGVAVREGWQP